MPMPPTVLLNARHEFSLWTLPESEAEGLARDVTQVRFVHCRSDQEFDRLLPEAEVLFGWGLDAGNFERATRLRWVQITAAGAQRLLFPAMVSSDVVLTNTRGLHAAPIAEHVMGVILSFARKLHLARDAQTRVSWEQESLWGGPPPLRELGRSTLGLVGVGGIGAAVAARARAFGMRVLGLRRRALPSADVDEVLAPDRLDELLERSDYLVVSVPSTPETRGMIGATQLARMREDAVIVNVGRGRVVDEDALATALRSGRPAGAALDVFGEEPLPESSPLWRMPQVLLTPHLAGATPHYWSRAVGLFRENLRRFLGGEPLLNVVDKHAGY
jgi:phosphoglycerate dehydrogenase-like enzyme